MSDLIEQVYLQLEGYTQDQATFTTVTDSGGIDDDDTSVTTATAVSPGLIEIGDELIYVGSVNSSTKVASGLIRGFRGTTAVAHAAGDTVIDSPKIPRIQIKRAINEAIMALGQRVGAIQTYTFTASSGAATYDVPSDCVEVRNVAISVPGIENSWVPSRHWRFNRSAGSPSTSGRTVTLGEWLPGRSVRITYTSYATTLLNEVVDDEVVDDDYTDSGLPEWTREIVALGACAKLVTFLDAGALIVRSGDQHTLNGQVPWGSSMSLSKYLNALWESRVDEAAKRQRQEWDTLTHWQG